MDFKHLEIFVALVENMSFSITATNLKISQPTVTLILQHLEEELDTPLFLRSTRELRITDAGKQLYGEAKKLIKEKNKIVEKFSHPSKKVITIGASTIPAGYITPSIIASFKEKNSDVLIRLEEKNSMETIKKVSNNIVDIGIVGMKTEDENCEFKAIFKDEFVFIAANNAYYQKLFKSNPDIKRLSEEPLIIRESGSAVKQNTNLIFDSQDINTRNLNIAASINDTEVIKQITAQGIGTSFISKIAAEDMIKNKKLLAYELPEIPHKYREIYLVWNRKITYSSYLKDFLDCALEYKGTL